MKIHEIFKQMHEEDKREVAEGYKGIKIKIKRSGEFSSKKEYIVDGKEIKTWQKFDSLSQAKTFIDFRIEAKKKSYYQLEAANCLYALYRYDFQEHGAWYQNHIVNLSKDYEEAIKKAKIKVEQLNANTDYPIDLKVSSSVELEEFAYGKLEADRKKREQFAKDYPELIDLFDIYNEWHNRYADLVDKYAYEVEDGYGGVQTFSGESVVDKRRVESEDLEECNLVLAHRRALNYLIAEFCDQYDGNKYREGKSLSDKQIEALIKFRDYYYKASKENIKRQKAFDEERAKAKDVPLTDERIEFVGEIVKVKWHESKSFDLYANGPAVSEKMVFKSDDGYMLWGTFPQALWKLIDSSGHEHEDAKGKRISFVARVQRSKNDPKFGFYKRPTKALVEGE